MSRKYIQTAEFDRPFGRIIRADQIVAVEWADYDEFSKVLTLRLAQGPVLNQMYDTTEALQRAAKCVAQQLQYPVDVETEDGTRYLVANNDCGRIVLVEDDYTKRKYSHPKEPK